MSPRPLIIAHRGFSARAPENTLPAITLALEAGADGVEIDVQMTRDGHLVVIHDHVLHRTTAGTGTVAEHTLEEIRRLDAGVWYGAAFQGTPPPTLGEVLDLVRGRAPLFIEIKAYPALSAGIEDRLVDTLRATGDLRPEQVQISCFEHVRLRRIAELAPRIPTGILYTGRPVDPLYDARQARAHALHPNWAYVTAEDVAAAHDAGLKVNTWTVNDAPAVPRLAAMGVDGIITGDPVMARTALKVSG